MMLFKRFKKFLVLETVNMNDALMSREDVKPTFQIAKMAVYCAGY